MHTVGSLIQEYLRERGMTANQLAEKSGVSRQRLSEIIGKDRCPAEHNLRALLKAMKLDANRKRALIEAHCLQSAANADRKEKTGRERHHEATSRNILAHWRIRVLPMFSHHPCIADADCDFNAGLHSIMNVLTPDQRKFLLFHLESKKELQEYYETAEKGVGSELETFASSYKTHVNLTVAFQPVVKTNDLSLHWKFGSIFDGLIINRVEAPFYDLLKDIPLWWNDRQDVRHRGKGHMVTIDRWSMSGEKRHEAGALYFGDMRSISIPERKKVRTIPAPEIFRAVEKRLKEREFMLTEQIGSDTAPIRYGDIYDLSDHLDQLLRQHNDHRRISDNIIFYLRKHLVSLRIAPIAPQFEAIMLRWAGRYFEKMGDA